MRASTRRRTWWLPAILSAGATLLLFAPEAALQPLRAAVRDAVAPGQRLLLAGLIRLEQIRDRRRQSGSAAVNDGEIVRLRQELAVQQRINRQLVSEMVRRQKTPAAAGALPGDAPPPLLAPELLPAMVLGRQRAELTPPALLIDRGTLSQVLESLPVVDGAAPVIDRGVELAVHPDLPVYAGRIVVGRIASVGRWASTVRLVTDPHYRGRARLVRATSQGRVSGGTGVFEGRGEKLCRLTRIGAEEQVRVGDDVYTADESVVLPYPMYYGRVVRAELPPGALEWDIWVEPALQGIELDTVSVLRTRLNPPSAHSSVVLR